MIESSRASCTYRISVKALILDESERILLVQESNGMWESPAANVVYKTTLTSLDFKPSDECVAINFFTAEEIVKLSNAYENVRQLAEQLLYQRK